MRITLNDETKEYFLEFVDIILFESFLDYLEESIATPRYQKPFSMYNTYVTNKEEATSKWMIIKLASGMAGVENLIGKFLLESDQNLPKGLFKIKTNLDYKQPVFSNELENYQKGVCKILLGDFKLEAEVPKHIIARLQGRDSLTVAIVQMACQWIKENIPLIPDLHDIVFGYLLHRDQVQMVQTARECKILFFKPVRATHQANLDFLSKELTSFLESKNVEWRALYWQGKPLNIAIGINKSRPTFVTPQVLIELDRKNCLMIRDKRGAILEPLAAFEAISEVSALVRSSKENPKAPVFLT